MEESDVHVAVFSLSEPIRSSILNYKKFVKHLDLSTFSCNQKPIQCHCKKYNKTFIDTNCKHILTGDLRIIKNNKLHKLFTKGPKYREPEEIKWDDGKKAIVLELESFIERLSNVKGVSEPYFDNWKHTVLSRIDSKISFFEPKIKNIKIHKVLDNADAKRELKELQEHFVLVPIDKAANNVSFICKKHYANVIKRELGFIGERVTRNGLTGSLTYDQVNVNPNQVINSHLMEVGKYGLEVEEEMRCLPTMYWSPKLHKSPIGSRFIIASKLSTLKPLLKDLTCIFKLFQKQIESFNDKSRVWSGVSGFWVIQNSNSLIERIGKINKHKKAKSVMTFDFVTLYTKIPHNLLINVLNEVIDFCFQGGLSQAIYLNKYGASWRNCAGARVYSKVCIKNAVKFSIENAFFQVGDMIFRQKLEYRLDQILHRSLPIYFFMSMKVDSSVISLRLIQLVQENFVMCFDLSMI